MILARLNKVLLDEFIELVLHRKKRVKFRKKNLIQAILRELKECVLEYISRYNKGTNIECDLEQFIDINKIDSNKNKRTKNDKEKIHDEIKRLLEKNKSISKEIRKNSSSIYYFLLCMKEFREKGSYRFIDDGHPQYRDDVLLRDYFETIMEFIDELYKERFGVTLKECRKDNVLLEKVSVNEFLEFLENFLLAYNGENEVNKNYPILSTIHQMKGAEADRVFIIDYPLMPYSFKDMSSEQRQQELNLKYVAITRAKKELILVRYETDDPKQELFANKINKECELITSSINESVYSSSYELEDGYKDLSISEIDETKLDYDKKIELKEQHIANKMV